MPTAAKLVAALSFALVAYLTSMAFIPTLPEHTPVLYFSYINAGIGIVIGWTVMGRQVGRGILASARRGLGTSIALLFWAVLAFSMRDMLIHSTKMVYRTPTKAVLAVFDNMVEFFLMTLTPPVILTLVIGGMIAGVLAEISNRLWR